MSSPPLHGGVFETTEFEVHVQNSDPADLITQLDRSQNQNVHDYPDESILNNEEEYSPDIDGDQSREFNMEEITTSLFEDTEESDDIVVEKIEDASEVITASSDSNKGHIIGVHEGPAKLPIGRIRSIMKCDPEVHAASLRAVFLVTRATELFMQWLGKELYTLVSKQKKQTIDKKDIEQTIFNNANLEFLEGAIDLENE